MPDKKTIEIVQNLINTCRDGQNGYRDAAEHVTDSNLRQFLNQQSLARAGFAGELEQELISLGEANPGRGGSISGAIHRAWIDFKSTLGGGDATILRSVEAGEDSAKQAYEKALAEGALPEPIAIVARRQLASIAAAHDHVRSLRDAKAA
ncbi:MAG TPA: PA2169 family four-helix-bundle protein [Terriglobales bacterium]|nr:PA2169 family four-helix-bundle protein [Terriglobales bacterium]